MQTKEPLFYLSNDAFTKDKTNILRFQKGEWNMKKNDEFVKHIENHLRKMYAEDHIVRYVCCKICGRTIDEIYEDSK
jgi:hypothetical protein